MFENNKEQTKQTILSFRKIESALSLTLPRDTAILPKKKHNKKVPLSLGATVLRALFEIIVIRETES